MGTKTILTLDTLRTVWAVDTDKVEPFLWALVDREMKQSAVGMIDGPLPRPHGHDTTQKRTIAATINHGRWIVQCPECMGAQMALPSCPVFFCDNCFNEWAGGKTVTVEFPPPRQRAAIETALLKRPRDENRNWAPPETVKDLNAENKEML